MQSITQQVYLTMFIEDENITTCFGLIRPIRPKHVVIFSSSINIVRYTCCVIDCTHIPIRLHGSSSQETSLRMQRSINARESCVLQYGLHLRRVAVVNVNNGCAEVRGSVLINRLRWYVNLPH